MSKYKHLLDVPGVYKIFWRRGRKIFTVLLLCLLVVIQLFGTVYAQYSPDDYNCMRLNTCWYDPSATVACGQNAETTVATSSNFNENLITAYNYFLSKKGPDGAPLLTKIQAAAIIGNIAHESGGDPQNTQGGFTPDRTTDPTQVSTDSKGRQGGWGLIQWTPASKVLGIAQKANITGPIYELGTQLDLVWWHMTTVTPLEKEGGMLAGFTQTDLAEAVKYYEATMEAAGTKAYDSRIKAAELALTYQQTGATFMAASTGCQCSTQNALNVTGKTVVVLDPGHAGTDTRGTITDPETGLYIGESTNPAERKQVWNVAQTIKGTLEAKGYTVILTKKTENEVITLKQRAVIANEANAAIAVSIHTDAGAFGTSVKSWVTPQEVGGYRTNDAGVKTIFSDTGVAQKSLQYTNQIIEARKAAGEKGTIQHKLNFTGRTGLSPGDISIVQLLSKVPWVYNEAGQAGFNGDVYAVGIANGIMNAVPLTSGQGGAVQAVRKNPSSLLGRLGSFFSPRATALTTSSTTTGACGSAASGNAALTAINYAWSDYRRAGQNPTEKKPVYEQANLAAKAKGKYTGDTCFGGGVDCGAFVTRVMQDSGLDPNYGGRGNTRIQLDYVLAHPELYEEIHPYKAMDLQAYPFAIALRDGHTYMYVGLEHPGFNSNIASASQCERAPMAGKEAVADPGFRWFVLKSTAPTI